MSYYERKRDRSGELRQAGLKVILKLGNFLTDIRKKDVRTSPYGFVLSSENWMHFTEEKHYLLFRVF